METLFVSYYFVLTYYFRVDLIEKLFAHFIIEFT